MSENTPMLQYKNGKLTFPVEKKLNLERLPQTVQLLGQQFTQPDQQPSGELLALLVEDAESSLQAIAKTIHKKLVPETVQSLLTVDDIQQGIDKIAERKFYGIDGVLSKFKWEANLDLFPEAIRTLVEQKRNDREVYQENLVSYFNSLTDEEKATIQVQKKRKDPPSSSVKQSKADEKKRKYSEQQELALKGQTKISGFFTVNKPSLSSQLNTPSKAKTFEQYFPKFMIRPHVTMASYNIVSRQVNFESQPSDWLTKLSKGKSVPKPLGFFDSEMASQLRRKSMRIKLLQFHENYRPPFYGSISKPQLSGRRFLQQQLDVDYEYDSDDEWESEEEGEELMSNDGEDESEVPNSDDDDQDGWMVKDGYLSDDELGDGERSLAPTHKKVKFVPQKPIVVGPYLQIAVDVCLQEMFSELQIIRVAQEVAPVATPSVKKPRFPEEQLEALKSLVISSKDGVDKLVLQFLATLPEDQKPSKKATFDKIKEIATRDKVGEQWRLV